MRPFTASSVKGALFLVMLAAPARSEVLVRWKKGTVPSREALGVAALVVTAGSSIAREAAGKDYRVLVDGDAALAIDDSGKWPRIRGNLRMRDGRPVQAASRTVQPWIESNVALIRVLQAAGRRPVLGYVWKRPTDADSQLPAPDDYSLAIAEAGAFGADLVLDLDEEALPAWGESRPYLEYYARKRGGAPVVNVGVLTRDPAPWYEVLNLLARHNVPYRILVPPGPHPAEELDLTVVTPEAPVPAALPPERLLRLDGEAADPNGFALKVWNALGRKRRLVDIWNGITVLTALERADPRTLRLELVNYSTRPLPVQARVKGTFRSVEYSRPEGPSQTLAVEHLDGFTEFVVPELRIGGTVSLRPE